MAQSGVPPRSRLRKILEDLLDADRKALLLDYFPAVATRLSEGMDSVAQVNLLLSLAQDAEIWAALHAKAEDSSIWQARISKLEVAASRPVTAVLPRRNHLFTGREDALSRLHETVHRHHGVAVTGLGGIGKSSLLLEYAHRHAEAHSLVYWLSGVDSGALGLGLLDLGRHIRTTGLADANIPSEQQPEELRAYVRTWLTLHSDWLLIIDNAADPEQLRALLPDHNRGYLLCSMRANDPLAVGLHPFELTEFSPEEAIVALTHRRGLTTQTTKDEAALSRELVMDLGCLPLAIEQAGAFMAAHKTSVRSYLAAYKKRRTALFPPGTPGREQVSVATVWSLSFEQVERENAASADLLRLSAFLSPDFIPERLLTAGANHLGASLSGALALEDPLSIDLVLGPLLRHSLVRRLQGSDNEQRGYSLHRLVQDVVRLRIANEERIWAERAVCALNAAFPRVEFRAWPACRSLIHSVEELWTHIERLQIMSLEAARLLHQASIYLWEQASPARAEPLHRRALAIRESVLGSEHPDTAELVNDLAVLLSAQGNDAAAEPLHQRALSIRETTLGLVHPDTGESLNNLGNLYLKMGRVSEAERLHRRALDIYEQVSGPMHPDTARSWNNLAGVLQSYGMNGEAEQCFRRALGIWEQVLGRDHPYTAKALLNLASVLHPQGRIVEAEPLVRRALAIQEGAFGPDHPSTTLTRAILTMLFG